MALLYCSLVLLYPSMAGPAATMYVSCTPQSPHDGVAAVLVCTRRMPVSTEQLWNTDAAVNAPPSCPTAHTLLLSLFKDPLPVRSGSTLGVTIRQILWSSGGLGPRPISQAETRRPVNLVVLLAPVCPLHARLASCLPGSPRSLHCAPVDPPVPHTAPPTSRQAT